MFSFWKRFLKGHLAAKICNFFVAVLFQENTHVHRYQKNSSNFVYISSSFNFPYFSTNFSNFQKIRQIIQRQNKSKQPVKKQ